MDKDTAVEIQVTDSQGGGECSVLEKRNGQDSKLDERTKKKAKSGVGEMRRVAEIVMVLAAMAEMRGARDPTASEVAMMTEARMRAATMCEQLAPRDLVEREAVEAMIDDLGLNGKLKEQRLGFRTSKISISEKMALSKRRMEESKDFATRSATISSQQPQTSMGVAGEICRTSNDVHVHPSDKPVQGPFTSGSFPTTVPFGSASPATSSHQLATNGVRSSSMVSSGLPSSNVGKDSTLTFMKAERPPFKLDTGARSMQADHSLVNAPVWSVQPQPSLLAKSGTENKVANPVPVKIEEIASRIAPQAARDQASRPFITQNLSVNFPTRHHQPFHGKNIVQAPPLSIGNGIAKIVQKLLQPRLPEHSTWSPPSRDYMNKAFTCQICKMIVNDVESVLVCDSCEGGFHLKCLQLHSQKTIPRGEWHCTRCLALSSGKPIPLKYGRVTRNGNAAKMSAKTAEVNLEKKAGAVEQKMAANRSSGLQSSHTGSNRIEPANVRVTRSNSLASARRNVDDKPSSHRQTNVESTASSEGLTVSPATSENSKSVSKMSRAADTPVPESTSGSSAKLADTCKETSHCAHDLQKAQDTQPTTLPNCAEVPMNENPANGQKVDTSDNNPGSDTHQHGQDVTQTNTIGSAVLNTGHELAASGGLHYVDWIGEALRLVDGKIFYQSCCINGIMYKVHDYALFRSCNDKLVPSKLQAMWEDSKTRSRWVIVHHCYFPVDLPEVVGRPCSSETNEVYESNHESTIMAGLTQGPCEVLPSDKYQQENARKAHLATDANNALRPTFFCKWFYDEHNGLFRPVSS